jgi:hypothetical protein
MKQMFTKPYQPVRQPAKAKRPETLDSPRKGGGKRAGRARIRSDTSHLQKRDALDLDIGAPLDLTGFGEIEPLDEPDLDLGLDDEIIEVSVAAIEAALALATPGQRGSATRQVRYWLR